MKSGLASLDTLAERVVAGGFESADTALESLFTLERGAAFRRDIPIVECGEPLVEIPQEIFPRVEPHPYRSAGAPYASSSPHHARESVVRRLIDAQNHLDFLRSGLRIQIFDAYRPLAVQTYMVNYELRRLALARGLDPEHLDEQTTGELLTLVHTIWARPTDDPGCPTPHSTGGAIDITIVDDRGAQIEMGSPIDEIGDVSLPNFFARLSGPEATLFHRNRILLRDVMCTAGFRRLPYEWWHFSYGDQLWALVEWLDGKLSQPQAIYGRLDS